MIAKGQKHVCLFAGPASHTHTGSCSSTVPPVGDNNGFAPVLSASYWKESVNNLFMQRLSNNFKCAEVELLLDLLEIIHGNTPKFQTYAEENVKEMCLTHKYKVKMKNCVRRFSR